MCRTIAGLPGRAGALVLMLIATGWGTMPAASQDVVYDVLFEGNWTLASTPGGVVSSAHFTTLIGGVHGSGVSFWQRGGRASAGVEDVAELGSTGTFRSEVRASPHTLNVIQQSVSFGGTGTASFSITVRKTHPLVTLLSMIGPSPDWFVGISGLSLLDASDNWLASVVVDLFPYDAGTEEGTEFALGNPDTSPQGTITRISGQGKFSNVRMARLTFTQRGPTRPTVSLSASPNPVAEGDPVTVSAKLSEAMTSSLEVPIVLAEGTAEPDDISALSTITIEGGQTTGTGIIQTTRDDDEDDETFTVSLGSLPSEVAAGRPSSVEITIIDDGPPPPENNPPTVRATCEPCTVPRGSEVQLSADASDADGDALTYSWSAADGTFTSATDQANAAWMPPDRVGTFVILVTVTDEYGADAVARVSIRVINRLPMIDAPMTVDLLENADGRENPVMLGLVQATDPDGDEVSFSLVPENSRFAIGETSGELQYVGPGEDFEADPNLLEVTLMATDALGGETQATITVQVVNVNERPVGVDDALSVEEDQEASIEVLTNDHDPDTGDQIRVVSVGSAEYGQATASEDGTAVQYVPDPNFHGSDQFTYAVSDMEGLTDTATVHVTVTPVNDSPVASDDRASTKEDLELEIPVLNNDTDVDGDSLHVQSVSSPEHGAAQVGPDQKSVSYVPDPNYHGADQFTYVVTDGGGLTDMATVQVMVTSINDAPVATDDQAVTLEDESVEIPVLSNDTDPDGDRLRVLDISSAEHGTPKISPDGTTVSYTPDSDYHGPDAFTYVIADAGGLADTAQVRLTVTPVNDAPDASDDVAAAREDEAVEIPVLDNDTDIEGDALHVQSVSAAEHGTTAIATDRLSISFVPDPNYHGMDHFTYVIADVGGLMDTATVRVTVSPINDAPDATDDVAATREDEAVEIPVLDNDTDIEGDALHVQSVSAAEHGTTAIATDRLSISFVPDPNYHGMDHFTYVVADVGGLMDTATVMVTVSSINDAPVASDDQAATLEDEPIEIPVLDNDADPDGDQLRVLDISSAEHGTPEVSPNGTTVSYTPDADYNGPDRFMYIVADAGGLTDTATVSVDVTPVNDGPVAVSPIPDQMLDEGSSEITIELTPFYADTDGDPLTFSAESSDLDIVSALVRGADLVIAPVASGSASVSVTATDQGGLSATQHLSVGVSDQPVRAVLGDAFAALARSHLSSVRMTLERRVSGDTPSAQTSMSQRSGLRVGGRPIALPNPHTIRTMAQRIALGWLPAYGQIGSPNHYRPQASGLPQVRAVPGMGTPVPQPPASFRNPLHFAAPIAGLSDMDFTLNWTGSYADSLRRSIAWSAWGQSDLQRYGGMAAGSGTGDYSGNLNVWYLGIDAQLTDWLFGIALGRSEGEGDWTVGTATGQLTTTVTSVYPYLRWSHGATNIWATVGMGRGEARNERATGRVGTSPLSMALGLLDYRRQLGPTDGPVAFGIRADAGWTSLSTDDGTATINGVEARVHQARLGLDVRSNMNIGRAGFAPFGAVHARHDGGDGQNGRGIEISGGLQAQLSLIGLGLQGRWLAFHSATDYEESGFGLTLTVGGQDEEGFSLSASPHWGGSSRAGVALWQDHIPITSPGSMVRAQGWTLDVLGTYRRQLRDRTLTVSTGYDNGWGGPNLQLTGLVSL